MCENSQGIQAGWITWHKNQNPCMHNTEKLKLVPQPK